MLTTSISNSAATCDNTWRRPPTQGCTDEELDMKYELDTEPDMIHTYWLKKFFFTIATTAVVVRATTQKQD